MPNSVCSCEELLLSCEQLLAHLRFQYLHALQASESLVNILAMENDTTHNLTHFVLNTGAKIPSVGLGTWQTKGDICRAAVRTALEVGYRHVDCAHLYGNEVEVGQALAEALGGGLPGLRREALFVTSKLLCTTNTPKRVEAAVEVSLKNLTLSYLDLYLIHWPDTSSLGDATDPPHKQGKPSPRIKETWRAMERLVEKGLVRAIGVSNFSISQIEELLSFAKIVPAVNQVELHPFWRQDDLLKFCHAKGIHMSAHTPLGLPGSSLRSTQDHCSSGEHESTVALMRSRSGHAPMLKTSVVETIAERVHKTPAQVVLRWAIQRGTSVLPRSLHPERIKLNFNILNWSLSDSDWNEINSMEPQLPLIDSQSSHHSEDGPVPLQAVEEMDDNEPTD